MQNGCAGLFLYSENIYVGEKCEKDENKLRRIFLYSENIYVGEKCEKDENKLRRTWTRSGHKRRGWRRQRKSGSNHKHLKSRETKVKGQKSKVERRETRA